MAIQPGDYDAEILTNDMRAIGDKEYVLLMVKCVDDYGEFQTLPAKIWLTAKAMGMARAALKLCGFDVVKDDLAVLVENKTHLAGRRIPVVVENQEKYGLQASVKLSQVTKKRLGALTAALRANDDGEPPAMADANKELQQLAEEARTAKDDGIPF